MDRRSLLKGLGACLGAAAWPAFARPAAAAKRRPNLIMIITDDQGWADLGCQTLRDRPVRTPNIDRIAERGVRMTDAYANAPICSPSRAALLTGRYQQRFGYYDNWESQVGFSPDQRIAPRLLKPLGYTCSAIGKWHLGWFRQNHPLAMGFDDHFGFSGGMHDYFEPANGETWEGGPYDVNWVTDNGRRVESLDYMPNDLTDHALEFIEANRENPFFIYLAYTTPHGPHQALEQDLERYIDDPDMDPNRKVVRAMYDALDRNVGRLLDRLDALGLNDDTLIVYMGDNGGLAEHAGCDNGPLRGSKGYLTEGGIRVPAVACWPARIPAGTVYREPVMHMDILPTMLNAAGADPAALPPMEGVNLLPHWCGEASAPPHETLHWQMHHESMDRWAIRAGDWKLVRARNAEGLYNLREDIGETHDLSERHPEIVERLTRLHAQWHARNTPSRVNEATRRVHIWELRFREDMGDASRHSIEQVREVNRP